MKQKYYLTFCNKHQHRRAYFTILASSYENAYALVVATFGMNWQNLYNTDEMDFKKYPKGSIQTLEN